MAGKETRDPRYFSEKIVLVQFSKCAEFHVTPVYIDIGRGNKRENGSRLFFCLVGLRDVGGKEN